MIARKAKAFIQLTHQNQAGIGGDARPLKRDLQKSVERELKGLTFVIHGHAGVSPSVALVSLKKPAKIKA